MSAKEELRSAKEHYENKLAGEASLPDTTSDIGYPAKYFDHSEAERKLAAKRQIRDAVRTLPNGDLAPLQFVETVTDEDVQVAENRDKEIDLFNFETWLTSIYDPKDPNLARLLTEMYPEYFQKRLDALENRMDMARRIAKIKLMGPRDRDDLWLLYNLQQGRVPHYDNLDPDSGENRGDIRRGLFNPKKWALAADPTGTTEIPLRGVKDPLWSGWGNVGADAAGRHSNKLGGGNLYNVGAVSAWATQPANTPGFLRFPFSGRNVGGADQIQTDASVANQYRAGGNNVPIAVRAQGYVPGAPARRLGSKTGF